MPATGSVCAHVLRFIKSHCLAHSLGYSILEFPPTLTHTDTQRKSMPTEYTISIETIHGISQTWPYPNTQYSVILFYFSQLCHISGASSSLFFSSFHFKIIPAVLALLKSFFGHHIFRIFCISNYEHRECSCFRFSFISWLPLPVPLPFSNFHL